MLLHSAAAADAVAAAAAVATAAAATATVGPIIVSYGKKGIQGSRRVIKTVAAAVAAANVT